MKNLPQAWCRCFLISLCVSTSANAGDLGAQPLLNLNNGDVAIGVALRYEQSPYLDQNDTVSQYSDNGYDQMPLYYYEGRHFFIRGPEAGITLFENEQFSAEALASYRFQRLESGLDGALAGLKERDQTWEGGARVAWRGNWGQVEAHYLTDIENNHEGSEWGLTYQYLWQRDRWRLSPFVSYLGQDAEFSDYYYGVDADEVLPDRLAYNAEAGSAWRAGLRAAYQWTPHLTAFANVSATALSDAASDSPIVDKDVTAQLLAGFTYTMGNVKEPFVHKTLDPKADRALWSWRVNYGYTAQETFHKVHRGYMQRNRDVNTRLAGLTIGRLIDDGRKVDFWLKGSMNRRFEDDLQPDFWELNLYTQAMGTGYSAFSGRELFRYGFGFGFSYAHRVPIVEQIKQARRGERDGHFLNYLEAQLDTPLSNLFGKRAWRNCYAGLTLVHRSGIFGSSDFLGNVSGGSDVVTAHLECKR